MSLLSGFGSEIVKTESDPKRISGLIFRSELNLFVNDRIELSEFWVPCKVLPFSLPGIISGIMLVDLMGYKSWTWACQLDCYVWALWAWLWERRRCLGCPRWPSIKAQHKFSNTPKNEPFCKGPLKGTQLRNSGFCILHKKPRNGTKWQSCNSWTNPLLFRTQSQGWL